MNLFKKSFALFSFLFLFILGLTFISINKIEAAVVVTVTADNTNVAYGGSTTIHWTSTGATSCSESGGRGGNLTTGSFTVTNMTSTTTFTVNCTASYYTVTIQKTGGPGYINGGEAIYGTTQPNVGYSIHSPDINCGNEVGGSTTGHTNCSKTLLSGKKVMINVFTPFWNNNMGLLSGYDINKNISYVVTNNNTGATETCDKSLIPVGYDGTNTICIVDMDAPKTISVNIPITPFVTAQCSSSRVACDSGTVGNSSPSATATGGGWYMCSWKCDGSGGGVGSTCHLNTKNSGICHY